MIGIWGQSSGRGTWWTPIVHQATMSVFMMLRFCFTIQKKINIRLPPY
jgi:hypothetical protein